jgi:N4-(beta-N-acetylglucosaminyl)-L-asparaginase
MATTRREFLRTAVASGGGALMAGALPYPRGFPGDAGSFRPIAVSSANGIRAVAKAMEMIATGSDALDAAIAGVNIIEEDPNDTTVGYGGLPNEDGVVELDAAVMHGPTHQAGAVAALRNIKNPSKVARVVMDRSDHVLMVGEGALRFARVHGFKEEDLLTEKAREAWLYWKEHLSNTDDWLPPHDVDDRDIGALLPEPLRNEFGNYFRHTGTIHCSALDQKGNISCVTTTSGLAFKIPGRVGDSPIIGAGLYCDNEVGSAGSTGRGEANLLNCTSRMVVEYMRSGKSPEEACLQAVKQIVAHTLPRRLQTPEGRPSFEVALYAINKRGDYGGARMYSGGKFAVHDGTTARLEEMAYLYKREPNK